jgi:hypothetical protein
VQGEKIGPLLAADFEQIFKTLGDEVGGARAPTLEQRVRAPGGCEAHGDRRQRATRRGRRDKTGGEQRCLLIRPQLHWRAAFQAPGHRLRQHDGSTVGVVGYDLDLATITQGSQHETRQESVWEGRGTCEVELIALTGPIDPIAQGAAAEDLTTVELAARVAGYAVGESPPGVDPDLPHVGRLHRVAHPAALPWCRKGEKGKRRKGEGETKIRSGCVGGVPNSEFRITGALRAP